MNASTIAQGLTAQTVNTYHAAIHNLQLSLGLPEPQDSSLLPHLKLVLAGIRWHQATSKASLPRIRRQRDKPLNSKLQTQKFQMQPARTGRQGLCGRTSTPLCPVVAVLAYVTSWGEAPGPFFVDQWENLSPVKFRQRDTPGYHQAGASCEFSGHNFI